MNPIARLFMGLMGLGLLALLLLALGLYTLYATLRWLLTGRKPQVVLVWQQFRQMRKGMRQGMPPRARWRTGTGQGAGPGFGAEPNADDVVDVQAREMVDDPQRLPPWAPPAPPPTPSSSAPPAHQGKP